MLLFSLLMAIFSSNITPKGQVLIPVLTKIMTIVNDPAADIRDPTAVLFDPITETWNFWATRIPGTQSQGGYNGTIYHYYSKSLFSRFNTSGIAINKSSDPADFDHHGVFTPGIMYDERKNEWLIYYGGVRTERSEHREQIGLAISKTGVFGPFIKQTLANPVITLEEVFWCDSNVSSPARVDEAKPYIIKNRKMIYTKGVCQNYTALDGIWQSDDGDTWDTPYTLNDRDSPIVNSLTTSEKKGFQNVKIFMGPDGYLHLTAHNHANDGCPHYISDDNNRGIKWKLVNMMKPYGLPQWEPAPVYPDGVPGDQGGIPEFMIQFVTSNPPYYVDLMRLTWTEANETNSVLFD